jgi:hypothetical protein
MSDLYDDDIVLWSERQSDLLRRRAAGELVNEAELDWPNSLPAPPPAQACPFTLDWLLSEEP